MAITNYNAQSGEELTMGRGDVVNVVNQVPGYYVGELDGKFGKFPSGLTKKVPGSDAVGAGAPAPMMGGPPPMMAGGRAPPMMAAGSGGSFAPPGRLPPARVMSSQDFGRGGGGGGGGMGPGPGGFAGPPPMLQPSYNSGPPMMPPVGGYGGPPPPNFGMPPPGAYPPPANRGW